MKIMSRDFTPTEKVLLVVLAIILLGLAYYHFVDQAVRDSITTAESERQMYQTELDSAQQKLMRLQTLRSSLDALEAEGKLSWMGSYNNSKEEVAFLNDILADAQKYSISFSDVSRSGDQIRRNFTLQYQTADYAAAQDIMKRLCQGKYRCLVGDLKCAVDVDGVVTINASATFYETMVGGAPDAGLPQDGAVVRN